MHQTRNENGNTLILVLVVMVVGALLVMGALRLSDNQTLQVFGFFNREDALRHAELGYNRFLWELNQDSTFYLDSNRFIQTVNTNEKQIYQPIDQPDNDNFLVEIEIPVALVGSAYVPVSNQVIIRSTGWTAREPDKKRTLQVNLVKRSFTQYSMITDSDIGIDNKEIHWKDDEECYGPLHTNGTLYIEGSPKFYGPVTYGVGIDSDPTANYSNIFLGGHAKTATINWPASNNKLMAEARTGGGGHYYQGRTCIMLHDDGYDVRRWVSYDSVSQLDNWEYNGHPYQFEKTTNNELYLDQGKYYFPTKAACGGFPTYTTSFKQLRSNYGSIDYPSNGVIYVDGGPSSSYTYNTSKFDTSLGNVFVSGQMQGQLTIACSNDIFITSYDPTDWRNPWKNGDSSPFFSFSKPGGVYYRSSSTDFRQVFSGGEWDHTEVTGANKDDILGLVADNNIYILHYSWPAQLKFNEKITEKSWGYTYTYGSNYGWTNGYQTFSSGSDPDSASTGGILIHGALFTTRGSFGFERHDEGSSKGAITLFGSIAQHIRGAVGTFSGNYTVSGFEKNYTHDPRMLYTSPPHYIEPANTGWQVGAWKELASAVINASS